jgi:ankyrin repeat protein
VSIINARQKQDELFEAIKAEDMTRIESLLGIGADVNAINPNSGKTPLCTAISYVNEDLFKLSLIFIRVCQL